MLTCLLVTYGTAMATTLWSPNHLGLYSYDVDMSFTSLPLSMSLNDDDSWPSSDVRSLMSFDVVQPQLSTFHTSTSSSNSTEPHHIVLDDQHVPRSQGDETSWCSPSASSDDIPTSVVGEVSSSNSHELISNDELDECFSHLLMTPQYVCHGNHNNLTAHAQSEVSVVNLLADQLRPSQYDLYQFRLRTTESPSDEKCYLNRLRTAEVRSSTFTCDTTNSDDGECAFCWFSFFHSN